jgi:nucleoside-diphosphate-sugar epimerase
MTDPSSPTVLILGANGRFGLAAAQGFAAAGWQVVASVRRAPDPGLPEAARVTTAAIDDAATLAREAAGARIVVHALNPPYTEWQRSVLPMARAGMDVAEALGARFMLPGNVYNYGADMPATLTDAAPQLATTRKGRLRIQMEDEIEHRCREGRIAATILRAGDFFGGGSGSWVDLVIAKSLRAGKLVYPGPTDRAHAWAYLPDLARAFVATAARPARSAARFEQFGFAGHTLTGAELLTGIEDAAATLGIAPARGWKHGSMPWGVIRLGGLVVPMWRELAEMAYLWTVPHSVDGAALERAVGPLPATPLAEALRETLLGLGFGAGPGASGA